MFSYGRADKGEARPQVLAALLRSTDRVVQQIDSVEYGLTDIQEYYANTGGLKRAAEMAQQLTRPGSQVATSFVESFSRDTTPRDLDELLRLEYRTKLLNPRWAQAMAAMGSGGAVRDLPADDGFNRLGWHLWVPGSLGLRPGREHLRL